MAGTTEGALKSWQKRRARGDNQDSEFYRTIGRKSHTGAFGADHDFARKQVKERWRRYHISQALRTKAAR